MKKHISYVFLIFLVSFMMIFLVACPIKTEEEISLHIVGTITDRDSGTPLADVTVDLYSAVYHTLSIPKRTNQEGQYEINYYGGCDASFRIRAYIMGYFIQKEPVECTSETQTVNIQLLKIKHAV